MKIDRKELKKTMTILDDLQWLVGNGEQFQLAVYLEMRLGADVDDLTDEQLDGILNAICNHETLFNESINEEVSELF